jgi:hypothetical protein
VSAESSAVIRRSATATFRSLNEGGVLLDLDTGAYFEVNASGRFLWESIGDGTDEGSLVESFAHRWELANEEAAVDVAAFLDELRQRHLLTP